MNLWIIVQVWRGFAENATAFRSKADAYRRYRLLSRNCNLEEGDVRVFEVPLLIKHVRRKKEGAPKSHRVREPIKPKP